MLVQDPIILFSDVVNGLPLYWQEFAKYHAEIGHVIIKDTSEKPENKA
jgi:hypothetical protein